MNAARITIFKNGSRDRGILLHVPGSIQQLLEVARTKLELSNANEIFTAQGGIVEDIDLIRDNDVLYIGEGEPFIGERYEEVKTKWDERRGIKRKPEGVNATLMTDSNYGFDNIDPYPPSSPAPTDMESFKLFVGCLPKTVCEDDLQLLFGAFGSLEEIKLLRDNVTGSSKGAAFIKFADKLNADAAMARLNGYVFPDNSWKRPMVVRYADVAVERNPPSDFKLFVGSIPIESTEDDLHSLFSQYGHVLELHTIRGGPSTKRAAFVRFRSRSEATNAIANLHRYKLPGKNSTPLVVRFADNRKSYPSSPSYPDDDTIGTAPTNPSLLVNNPAVAAAAMMNPFETLSTIRFMAPISLQPAYAYTFPPGNPFLFQQYYSPPSGPGYSPAPHQIPPGYQNYRHPNNYQ